MAYNYAHKQEDAAVFSAVPQKPGALTVTVTGRKIPTSATATHEYNADGTRKYLIVGDKPLAWSPPDRKTILREQLAAEERKEQESATARLHAEQQEKQEAAKRFSAAIAASAERIRGYVARLQQEREEKRQARRAEAARTGNRLLSLDLDD